MAIKIDVQSFVDAQVAIMQRTTLDEKAEQIVVASFDAIIDERISHHAKQIKLYLAEANGETANAQVLTYHRGQLAYYTNTK